VALQTRDALTREELAGLLHESYEMVLAKLPKKMQQGISSEESAAHSGKIARGGREKKRKKSVARKSGRRKR
jgi:hypothetical protein